MAKQRIAVVTGGMGGLGETISTKMADAGYRVVVSYSPSNTKYRSWLEEMKGRGYSFSAFPIDVVDFDSCARQCSIIHAEVGAIDILVNNAGIQRRHAFVEFPQEDWDALIATNLTAPFIVSQAIVPGMIARKRGKIVHIASLMSELARPSVVPYTAAKGGVRQLTRGMAVELAPHNIQVNAIAPGAIEVERYAAIPGYDRDEWGGRIPAGRVGFPDDIGPLAAFLCSEGARYMTGQIIWVDGGMTTRLGGLAVAPTRVPATIERG
jgi:acetoacetyl-CoA reductase